MKTSFVAAAFILYIASVLVIVKRSNQLLYFFKCLWYPNHKNFSIDGIFNPQDDFDDWRYHALITVPVIEPPSGQ